MNKDLSNENIQKRELVSRSDFPTMFWGNVSEVKKALNYSLSDIAAKNTISRSTLNYYLWKKDGIPSLQTLLRLAWAFEIKPSFFFYPHQKEEFESIATAIKSLQKHKVIDCNDGDDDMVLRVKRSEEITMDTTRLLIQAAQNLNASLLRTIFLHIISFFGETEESIKDKSMQIMPAETDTDLVQEERETEQDVFVEASFRICQYIKEQIFAQTKMYPVKFIKTLGFSQAVAYGLDIYGKSPEAYTIIKIVETLNLPIDKVFISIMEDLYVGNVDRDSFILSDSKFKEDDYIGRILNSFPLLNAEQTKNTIEYINLLLKKK